MWMMLLVFDFASMTVLWWIVPFALPLFWAIPDAYLLLVCYRINYVLLVYTGELSVIGQKLTVSFTRGDCNNLGVWPTPKLLQSSNDPDILVRVSMLGILWDRWNNRGFAWVEWNHAVPKIVNRSGSRLGMWYLVSWTYSPPPGDTHWPAKPVPWTN